MVVIASFFGVWKSPHNYTYMKMYVFHLPFLFLIFWASLDSIGENQFLSLKVFPKWLITLTILPIIFSGLSYILLYKSEATAISKRRIDLHEEIKAIDFKNTVMYASLLTPLDYMYPSTIPVPWMIPHLWEDQPHFFNLINHKVYFIIEKRPKFEYYNAHTKVIFENNWCYIVDSEKKVKDFIQSTRFTPTLGVLRNPFATKIYNSVNVESLTNLITFARDVPPETKAHNLEMGLPPDFDPALYLRLNPGLIEYWHSVGIYESGSALLRRGELHYVGFGANQKLPYK